MAMSVDREPVFWLLLNSACMASKPFLFLAVPLSEEAELGGDTGQPGQASSYSNPYDINLSNKLRWRVVF